ncbi:hypothetical protein [Treponema pectinovorum]|nr:hypothetical protein [Treponema pectinovorum]
MSEVDELANEIYSRYGTVKRARGNFLYTAKGVRLTDLFLEGGRAILGWGNEGTGAFLIFKNVLNRGVSGSFITDFNVRSQNSKKTRLSKAFSELLNSERLTLVFNSKEEALKTALFFSADSTSVYRPWNSTDTVWQDIDCVVVAPPLSWACNLWVLAVKEDVVPFFDESMNFKNIKLPAPFEAAIVRSVYDLIKALPVRQEKNWFIYDKVLTKYFIRKGPYLFPKVPAEKYADFVKHCLECELVISPIYSNPSIVPFGADFGVFRKLEKSPFEL